MKKTFLLFIALLGLAPAGYSQAITLTVDDIAIIGTNFNQRTDTVLALSPGLAGTNQTWDFHSLGFSSGMHLDKTISVVSPASLAGGARFVAAGANIAMTENDTLTNYFFKKSAEGLVVIGYTMDLVGNGDTVCIIFSAKPDTMITFPATYNTSFVTTIKGDTKSRVHTHIDTVVMGTPITLPIDSVRIKHTGTKSSIFDAWGTLIMPNGTVNALRQQTYEIMHDTVWVFVNFSYPPIFSPSWVPYDTLSSVMNQFIWWTKYAGSAIVTMDYDSSYLNPVRNIKWLNVANLGVQPRAYDPELQFYPNPAKEVITVISEPGYDIANIIDITGQEVFVQSRNSDESLIVNISGLSDGIYFIKLTGNNLPPLTRKFMVQH